MSSYKRYQVGGGGGGGGFFKWAEPGEAIEGLWEGTQAGRFGDNGVVTQAKHIHADGTLEDRGRLVFPIHTALVDKVARLRDGAGVHILYRGMVKGKSGNEYKDFEVWSDEQPADAEPSEKVPF